MPSPVRYSIIVGMFKQHGWTLVRVRGSHHVFSNGKRIFPVPVHRNEVKYVYVKQMEKIFRGEA